MGFNSAFKGLILRKSFSLDGSILLWNILFYFVRGSGRENMLSDTDVACVTIALTLCLVHGKNRCWTKEWYKLSPQYARTHVRTHIQT
jgi:hypothetical protein